MRPQAPSSPVPAPCKRTAVIDVAAAISAYDLALEIDADLPLAAAVPAAAAFYSLATHPPPIAAARPATLITLAAAAIVVAAA